MKVRDLMSYPIATVRPEATVLEAVKRMAAEKKGSLLVARDGLLKECLGHCYHQPALSQGICRRPGPGWGSGQRDHDAWPPGHH